MKEKEIREAFRYHSSDPNMIKKHEEIRRTLTEAVVKVAGLCPNSRERSCFITLMQQAQMMANASIDYSWECSIKQQSQEVKNGATHEQ